MGKVWEIREGKNDGCRPRRSRVAASSRSEAGSRVEKTGDPVEEKGQAEQDEKDDDEDENGGHASAVAGLSVVATNVVLRRFRTSFAFGAQCASAGTATAGGSV